MIPVFVNRTVPIWLLLLAIGPSFVCGQESTNWPAGITAREKLSPDRAYTYEFSEISVKTLQKWLGRVRIQIPVELDGTLSGWFWAQRSDKSWFDFSNYRIEGEIRSPDLKIDQWRVADSLVRFGYANGDWYVGRLAGELRSPRGGDRVGAINAKAKILTSSSSDLQLSAAIENVDLKSLFKSFGIELEISNSEGAVSFDGVFPVLAANNLANWKGAISLNLKDVALPWVEAPGQALGVVKLAGGKWELTSGQIGVAAEALTLNGRGGLTNQFPFELSLAGRQIDTNQLVRQLKNPQLADRISGEIGLMAEVKGGLTRGIEVANARIISDQLIVDQQPIDQLDVQARYSAEGIQLEIASAKLAGGELAGLAQWRDVERLARDTLQCKARNSTDLPLKVNS